MGYLDVIGDTIYLDGKPIAVFLLSLIAPERQRAEEMLGLRLPEKVIR